MAASIQNADSKTYVEIPRGKTVTIGRSQKADLHTVGMGVSSIHVEVTLANEPDTDHVLVKDVSVNGTGLVQPGQDPCRATELPHDINTIVPWGCGLIIPLRKPGATRHEPHRLRDVLWLHAGVAAPPAMKTRARPSTWPTTWSALPTDVQDAWQNEGIEDVTDLQTFYTSVQDLHAHLTDKGVNADHCARAATHWIDSARAVATARPTPAPPQRAEPRPRPDDPVPDNRPLAKRPRGPPKQLNAPGLWHNEWLAKENLKAQRAVQAQGLQPARTEHMEEFWAILRRAGTRSSLYTATPDADEATLKALILRPIARYADSMASRLAAWRRWERWAAAQHPEDQHAPFRPTGILMGKYLMQIDGGGTTAASQTWAALKWWSDRLGLDLALQSPLVTDFRMRVPGHTTEQAEVLPLDIIPSLRDLAREGGTRSTFASILLLIAGGCVRFLHAQRSTIVDITDELVVCRCAKGKRRQQGVREAYRWATPRCWSPGSDTAAKAVKLIQDVASKAPGYAEAPFLIPDLSTAQGHSISPGDVWLPRPMPYKKFVTLMRTLLTDMGSPGPARGWTFNALRRLMPTGADTLQFSDRVATAIGNWQETPKANRDMQRGRMQDQMSKRYAGEKVTTAGHYKIKIVAAIWHAGNTNDPMSGTGWSRVRLLYPNKRDINDLTKQFAVKGEMITCTSDPGCVPHLPRGPLRHSKSEPPRLIPSLEDLAWSMQSLPTSLQRPWVHFSPSTGDRPYCRLTKFRREAIRTGLGVAEAATTGERPCPKCVARLGDKAREVMAEFCLADSV